MGIHLEKNIVWKDTHTPVFTAELFIIANTRKQSKCPSRDEWIKKMEYRYNAISSVQSLSCVRLFETPQFSSVQSLSRVRLFATPLIAARQASLSITNSWSSLRLTSIEPWCHPAISSWAAPFSSCPQSLPASESFLMSQLFPWGGQSTGVSALASVLPKDT